MSSEERSFILGAAGDEPHTLEPQAVFNVPESLMAVGCALLIENRDGTASTRLQPREPFGLIARQFAIASPWISFSACDENGGVQHILIRSERITQITAFQADSTTSEPLITVETPNASVQPKQTIEMPATTKRVIRDRNNRIQEVVDE